MDSKALLYGIIGFLLGGFVVSLAATTIEEPASSSEQMSMAHMTEQLKEKRGASFDEAFIRNMIIHHEGAVEMAELSAQRAEHKEIKQLSTEIIGAQRQEITLMKQWQKDWGYGHAQDH